VELPPVVVSIMESSWQADPEARPPFRDIVEMWRRAERGEEEEERVVSPAGVVPEGGEVQGPPGGQGAEHEYCLTPLDWRRQVLHEKLVRRPSVFEMMQGGLVQTAPADAQAEGGPTAQLFGYDLMHGYLHGGAGGGGGAL
jgi:hypothetical protein